MYTYVEKKEWVHKHLASECTKALKIKKILGYYGNGFYGD